MPEIIKIRLTDAFKNMVIAKTRGQILARSMRGADANLVGTYGEQIIIEYLNLMGVKVDFCDMTTHDMDTDHGRVEVKTKERTVAPEPWHDCTVPAYNHAHQAADLFVFVSLLGNGHGGDWRFDRAFIVGAINLDGLRRRAKLWKRGMVDESNGWKPTIDCYNIKVADLISINHAFIETDSRAG